MNELDLLVENYFTDSFEASDLFRLVEQVMSEELYYKNQEGELQGPISDIDKIAQDIIKYVKRQFPSTYHSADLQLKKGVKVLVFTNFKSLKIRDEAIRELTQIGYLSSPEVKRSQLYHRATTNFVDISPSGKETPLVVQFDQGGGPASAGGGYEQEMQDLMNTLFSQQQKPYRAEKQGGSTPLPDIVIFSGEVPVVKMEAKTTIGSDFGQFKIQRDGVAPFEQVSQKDSPELVKLFNDVRRQIDSICPAQYDPQKSGDLARIDVTDLAERVERYYQEKDVDYIVINDMIYVSSDQAPKLPGALRFKDAAKGGYVRARVKCHGKSYSTTVAMKIASIEPSVLYHDLEVFNILFP
jgi:hypothetical protein